MQQIETAEKTGIMERDRTRAELSNAQLELKMLEAEVARIAQEANVRSPLGHSYTCGTNELKAQSSYIQEDAKKPESGKSISPFATFQQLFQNIEAELVVANKELSLMWNEKCTWEEYCEGRNHEFESMRCWPPAESETQRQKDLLFRELRLLKAELPDKFQDTEKSRALQGDRRKVIKELEHAQSLRPFHTNQVFATQLERSDGTPAAHPREDNIPWRAKGETKTVNQMVQKLEDRARQARTRNALGGVPCP